MTDERILNFLNWLKSSMETMDNNHTKKLDDKSFRIHSKIITGNYIDRINKFIKEIKGEKSAANQN